MSKAEAAMMEFGRAVARDASAVTAADVARLKQHGFGDGEIFDIAATASARAFWTKVIESLGVCTDEPLRAMDASLREAVAVGRPVRFVEPQRLKVGLTG